MRLYNFAAVIVFVAAATVGGCGGTSGTHAASVEKPVATAKANPTSPPGQFIDEQLTESQPTTVPILDTTASDAAVRAAIAPFLADPSLASTAEVHGHLAAVRTKPDIIVYFRVYDEVREVGMLGDKGRVELLGNVAPDGWTGMDDAAPFLAAVGNVYGKPTHAGAERVFAGRTFTDRKVGIVKDVWREPSPLGDVQTWQTVYRVTFHGDSPQVELVGSSRIPW